jgi:quercetin dioxygenase-like cupin family protein
MKTVRSTRLPIILGLTLTAGIALGAIAGVFGTQVVNAQQPPAIKRTDVLNVPMAGMDGKDAHMWVADIAPGVATGKHSHPTPRFVYVIAGAVTLEIEGQPSQTYKAGEGYVELPDVAHNFRNASTTEPAKALGFQIAAKGQPLQY